MNALPKVGEAITRSQNEFEFYTRQSDGVSGMTIRALSKFCGLAEGSSSAISNLLTQIGDSDPETNELPETLKSFAGKDLRLETNDTQNSMFIVDEVCHAVLEYYALDARKYKGKSIALNNYRMIARAGLRLFIWSKTGYQPTSLSNKQLALLDTIPEMQKAIASLQSQLQKLLPPSADYMPPGWNPEVWESLPPQDKQHFRFLYHQHGFIPSDQGIDPLEIPVFTTEHIKQRQRDEFQRLVGEVSQEELERMEAIKREILQQFLAQEG